MSKQNFKIPDDFDWCPDKPNPMQIYKLLVNDLSPTQFATGETEVLYKAGRMKKKFNGKGKLHDYLLLRPVPVVKYGKKFYLVDHHHMVRALYEALNDKFGNELFVYVKVMFDGSSLSEVHFWKAMFEHNYVYLFGADGGGPKAPAALPKHIRDIEFDPYRSLAWLVRDRHGYMKNNTPFSEFKWANFFRTRLMPEQDLKEGKSTFHDFAFEVNKEGKFELTDEGEDVVDEALFLSISPEAAGLPGYLGRA